jgi:hypothetical protein
MQLALGEVYWQDVVPLRKGDQSKSIALQRLNHPLSPPIVYFFLCVAPFFPPRPQTLFCTPCAKLSQCVLGPDPY